MPTTPETAAVFPFALLTRIRSAPTTTWRFVAMTPGDTAKPVPKPRAVRTTTTDRSARATTSATVGLVAMCVPVGGAATAVDGARLRAQPETRASATRTTPRPT